MADFIGKKMVGVARIELATPAMSTLGLASFSAEKRGFALKSGRTGGEQSPVSGDLYRTFTALGGAA